MTSRTLPTATTLRDTLAHGRTLDTPLIECLTEYQERISARYETATEDSSAYAAFMSELLPQWYAMLDIVTVSFCDDDPTPINPNTGNISFIAFVREVTETQHLRTFRSAGDHAILDSVSILHNGRHETMNSIFRAVHDFYGHLASGGHFGWNGETTAYYSHASMFTENARQALFCETVAQQCYYAIHNDFAPQRCVTFNPDDFAAPYA